MTDCICAQHGDLECPVHPDCASCGCQAHAHWQGEPYACIAGRIGCGCKRYRPHGFSILDKKEVMSSPEDYEVPTRIVVDDETWDKICEEMENPRPPTEAMRRLFDNQAAVNWTALADFVGASTDAVKNLELPSDTFDPAERAREKQASRDEDARALASGEKTREQLRRENASFAFPRDRVKLTPPKRER